MRIELHNETEYTERISFQDIWTHIRNLKYAGCDTAAITDRNSVYGIHIAEYVCRRQSIQIVYGVTLDCIDTDDRYDVVLLATNLTGRDNIFRLVELLERNQFSFGRAITRAQLNAHREGVLLGAAAKNGQIVRAIQHRRDHAYLQAITQDYDYLEFACEPYDIAAVIVQLAESAKLPLCAVQYAVLHEPNVPLEKYAYLTLCRYFRQETDAQYFKTPEDLKEEIESLYVLPAEKQLCQKILYEDPQRLLKNLEPMPTLEEVLSTNDPSFHAAHMQELRTRVNWALREKYGRNCPAQVSERVQMELREIDAQKQAHTILVLADMVKQKHTAQEHIMLAGEAANFEILYLLGAADFDPLPRHIYCRDCRCWLETRAEVGDSVACPHCGKQVIASGLNLPSESIHTFLNGAYFEIRASDALISRWKQEFEKANYIVLQTSEREPAPVDADMDALHNIATDFGFEAWRNEREFTDRLSSHLPRNWNRGALQRWLLPGTNSPDFLPHLPTQKLAKNYYRLEIQPNFGVECASVAPIPSKALSFLAACERGTGIPVSKIPLNAQDVLAYIRASLLNEHEPSIAAVYALRICGFRQQALHEENDLYPRVQEIARKMLPESFSDLTRIFLLQHGTGVWTNNAEFLLTSGTVTPNQVIACREDVMEYLLAHGVERSLAYEMMVTVRRGQAGVVWNPSSSSETSKQQQEILRNCGAEEWFIESCRKVKYLFPRAHAAAFSANLIRLVWYCLHTPECVDQILRSSNATLPGATAT